MWSAREYNVTCYFIDIDGWWCRTYDVFYCINEDFINA